MRVILVLVILFTSIFADDDYKKIHLKRDLSYLHLTKSQKRVIKEALIKYRLDIKRLHHLEEKIEKEIERKFKSNSFKKEDYIDKVKDIKHKMLKIEGEFFEKIHKILTKEQRERFSNFIEEWEHD